jgi:hypothetical protein
LLFRSTLTLCSEKVTTKLYKQDASGDLQERQCSISYTVTVLVATASSPDEQPPVDANSEVITFAHSHIYKLLADMGSDNVPDAGRPTLIDIESSITDARMAYEKLQLTPWEPLLSKVEKFNELMGQIAEVTKPHYGSLLILFNHLLCRRCIHMPRLPGGSCLQPPK